MNTSSIAEQYATIKSIWHGSLQKQALLTTMRRELLKFRTIRIDTAVCLGLGSMDHAKPTLEVELSATEIDNSEGCYSWEDEVPLDHEPDIEVNTGHNKLSTTFLNRSLYQLIIFETVVECLKFVFKLDHIYFQDPKFSQSDIAFLQQRGHTILPYTMKPDKNKDAPLDPGILKYITQSTFVFAPALDLQVFAEVVCAGKPALLLSQDPLEDLAYPMLVSFSFISLEWDFSADTWVSHLTS